MRETFIDKKESDEASCALPCVKCDKRFFLEEEIHQAPSALPWDRMILTCPCTVISSLSDQNNYTCKRREDEVNRKGHLTKH